MSRGARVGALLAAVLGLAGAGDARAVDYGYDVPYAAGSPWPSMRRDSHNTARTPIAAHHRADLRPWSVRTGKGIFSTPILGADGLVYVGSADTYLYAVDRRGKVRWRFKTGGIIDAAAAIGRYDPRLRTSPITIGSGDERLYRLRSGPARLPARRRVLSRFRATKRPATGQLVNWWEGNVAIGPGGGIYAGNTGGSMYAFDPAGRLRWTYGTGNSVWTTPAFDADGGSYWGSVDRSFYKLDRNGRLAWSTPTLGFVVSSPALGSDGTVYIGSFDAKLYALDPATGAPRWQYQTADHIYSSPALGVDAAGRTNAVYIASTDGSVYALNPDGKLRWRYETGEPVRSSPALGRAPAGEAGDILYVGSSNGKLYALDAATGRRRWSFDTTPTDPVLRDRNDLNASPALSTTGVYIAGEHGRLWFVPYEYCRHAPRDRRCETAPGQEFPDDLQRVFPVTSGGTTTTRGYGAVPAAASLAARLVVRRGGTSVDAAMLAVPSARDLVRPEPAVPVHAETSPDGHYIFVVPDGFLEPATNYRLRFAGGYTEEGLAVGNVTVGGTKVTPFSDEITFRTAPVRVSRLPLFARRSRVSALRIRRLSIPLPPFLSSVNQIGFDSYDLIAGALAVSRPDARGEGTLLLWVIGGRRGPGGTEVADPKAGFSFPLFGRYRHDSVLLSARNLTLTFSFGDVPMRRFELRAQLDRTLRARAGASLYAEVTCTDVPNYGAFLYAIGLCNPTNTLAAGGTFLTEGYPGRGPAARRPRGLSVTAVRLVRPTATAAGAATARFALARGARYSAADHVASILLTDAASGEPVPLDYAKATTRTARAGGALSRVTVRIPRGTSLPARVRAYVIADVFPLAAREL